MISGPFLNRPSRELRDYYRVIKRPVCLRGVQKQVSGVKGRDKPTGVSQFKSWHAFEEETRNIWINARVYNEDGSEIFELANEFEVSTLNTHLVPMSTDYLPDIFQSADGRSKGNRAGTCAAKSETSYVC